MEDASLKLQPNGGYISAIKFFCLIFYKKFFYSIDVTIINIQSTILFILKNITIELINLHLLRKTLNLTCINKNYNLQQIMMMVTNQLMITI